MPMLVYLVTTMILARYLAPSDFGMIGVLSVFFMVADTLMDAGLGGSLIKESRISNLDCTTIFTFNIVVSCTLYVSIFILSDHVEQYFATEGLSKVVKYLCAIFVINSIGLVPRSLLIRELRFKAITYVNIASVLSAAIISVILAILSFGVFALVAYQVVSSLVRVLLSLKISGFKIGFGFSKQSLLRLLPFGLFTTFTALIDTIYENLITFLFGKYINMQQAGFVYQAKRLEEVPSQTVAQTINIAAFPVLTKLRDDRENFAKECTNTFKTILLIILPLLFIMAAFSELIILIVFGKDWIPAAPYLSLLVIAAVFHIAESLNRSFIKSTTQVSKLLYYTVLKRAFGIVIIFVFLFIEPQMVLVGYVVSTFVGYLANTHLLSRVSIMSIKIQINLFLKVLFPSVVFYCIMTFVKCIIDSTILELNITGMILLFYYFVVLRWYNVDVLNYIHQFIKK